MSELSKGYEPGPVEERWYAYWLKKNCFTANAASTKPAYSIVIPPPNVTGILHMGHVLNNTIQDILSRKARMEGKEVLWLPGTDHAGIATEGMVDKQIRKEEKKSKRDLGREEFLKRVWQWKEKHGGIIIEQLKKLGCSCDWTRERFTMDDHYVSCVKKVFVELYKKGLIYRGKRMVNWCPATQTALSDEEVEMKPQKSFMYHFKVEVAEAPGTWLNIATTRPETIPGDTAVAVNPNDHRYAHFIGKHILRPLPPELPREQKLIPIIGDEQVDFEFGTGVLKVTPAHDKADFEIGQRHKLPVVDIMNPDATMNDLAGVDLNGLERFKARKVAVEKLGGLGVLVEEKPYENNVGFSERAGVPIEPRLSEQWFLKYPSVAESKSCVAQVEKKVALGSDSLTADLHASEAPQPIPNAGTKLNEGSDEHKMHFHPQRWAKVYDHWLTNIQDWCISRQLWWGHRIPVWTSRFNASSRNEPEPSGPSSMFVPEELCDAWRSEQAGNVHAHIVRVFSINGEGRKDITKEVIEDRFDFSDGKTEIEINVATTDESFGQSLERAGAKYFYKQDPDVLDTWFSSWLWPFATMGWPEQTETLKKFYPTTDLVTGPDIIFFWVARMIMAGYEFMGERKFGLPDAMPFRNVYFTGIIRDKQGRKMSKTLGNSPDPVELIAKYGADALRFGTMRSAPLGQDILFDEKDVELGRNFCNKLWNACRFRQMQQGNSEEEIDPGLLTGDDKWILLKLSDAIQEITQALNDYKFNEATQVLYRFFWSEYCDWYLETTKAAFFSGSAALKQNTLAVIDFVMSNTLRLFHPFLPFITEELWQGMGYHQDLPANQGGETIMFATWPKPLDADFKTHYVLRDQDRQVIETRNDLVTQGRNLRREGNIPSNKKVPFVFKPVEEIQAHDLEVLKLLLNAESVVLDAAYQPSRGTPVVHSTLGDLFLPMEGLIDVTAEKVRLEKEMAKVIVEIEKVQQKLSNPAFAEKVPPTVLAEHKKRLEDWQEKYSRLQTAWDNLPS